MPTSSSSEPELADLPETPDATGAYPRLTDEQIMLLSRYGERTSLTKGTTMFCAGDRDCDLFVVLDGRVRVVQEGIPEGESRVLAVHGLCRFVGDLSILTVRPSTSPLSPRPTSRSSRCPTTGSRRRSPRTRRSAT